MLALGAEVHSGNDCRVVGHVELRRSSRRVATSITVVFFPLPFPDPLAFVTDTSLTKVDTFARKLDTFGRKADTSGQKLDTSA